jgi:hypothetical protein
MAEGRFFIWGYQPGWMPPWFMQPGHEKKAEYFKEIGKYRVATRKYLTYGELIDLIEPLNKIPSVKEVWINQWGEEKDAVIPSILGAVWKSENDDIAVFMVNLDQKIHEITYELNLEKYGVDVKNNAGFIVREIMPGKIFDLENINQSIIRRKEKLKPYEIKVLEFRRK